MSFSAELSCRGKQRQQILHLTHKVPSWCPNSPGKAEGSCGALALEQGGTETWEH